MDFKELGELIRQERERRGLSIEQVMDLTKISRRNLEAIEDARTEDLPHAVYVKGFIRNYTRLLEMDQAVIGEALARIFPAEEEYESQEDQLSPPKATGPTIGRESRKGLWLAIVLFLLGVVILTVLVFWLVSGRPEKKEPVLREKSGTEQGPETGEPVSSEPQAEPSAMVNATRPDDAAAPVSEQAPAQPEPEAIPVSSAEPAQPAVQQRYVFLGAVNATDIPEGADVLVVTAREQCWYNATIDDRFARTNILQPGQVLTLAFKDSLNIRLGNPSGVEVTYNGENYPLQVEGGWPADLEFP